MPYECKITKEEFPIPFTIGSHNLATWQIREVGQNDWQVFHEVNGMGTKDWQNSTPLGIDPRNRIGLFDENSMGYSLHDDNHRSIDLWTGSCEEAEDKFQTVMGENGLADAIQAADISYPPFGFIGEDTNSNAANTTVNLCVAGKDPEMPTWRWTPGEGTSLLPNEQIEQICGVDLSQHANSNNFFNDYLNQYLEEQGINSDYINRYDYSQFADNSHSYNGTSYLDDYNLSFGSGYWGSQYDNNNSTWDNSSNNIITEIELEKILDGNDEDKIKDTIMDLESGQLKIDTNGASSVLSSLEKKLEEYNISKLQIDDAILDNHNYSNSSISWENDNTWNDMSWEMNTINNQIQYEYYLYQKYLEEKEFWENMQIIEQTHSNVSDLSMDNNDDNSSSDNQNIKYEDNQSLSIQDDNTVSGSLNNNNNGEDNNVIAKVSDNPIILVKDENGIDKAMSVSEYAQYQNLLQDNLNNAFNHAQQTIQEQVNNDFDDFKQELHNNLVNLEQQFNQQLDEIASQEENSSIVDNENLDSDIADNLNNSDDMADLDLSLIDNHHGDSVSSDLSVIDDDIFSVVSDEEIFATHYDERWECKEEDPDDYWF